jgi:hypothetical protein
MARITRSRVAAAFGSNGGAVDPFVQFARAGQIEGDRPTDEERELFESYRTAWKAGVEAASSLRIGTRFVGAFGAADAAGYEDKNEIRAVFISGYLDTIAENYPNGVTVDSYNDIV